jgi:transposase
LLAARIGKTFAAPLLFEGPCNTTVFTTWLEKDLCPLLTTTHVVVRDTVPFHKSAKTQELIAHRGASLLFLPLYSPDLHPIAHDFATLKKIREYHEHDTLDLIIKTYRY